MLIAAVYWRPASQRRLPLPPITAERYQQLTGRSLDLCPCCGGRMVEIGVIPRATARAAAAPWNTLMIPPRDTITARYPAAAPRY